jgi:hypothetical protein
MKAIEPSMPEVEALAALVRLARRAREARDPAELDFILVNESHDLAPYRQAAVWYPGKGVRALSGVVTPEANAPYVQWLDRIGRHIAGAHASRGAKVLEAADLPPDEAQRWADWLPMHGLWLPQPPAGRHFRGAALILAREEPWTTSECALLEEWAGIWSQSRALTEKAHGLASLWATLNGAEARLPLAEAGPARWATRLFNWRIGLAAAVIATLFIPVRLTVLAPAELVPLSPAVIRAPLDGVIDRVLVLPNQHVREDDALFEFDRANLQSRLQIALRALSTIQAEYRQKAQQALFDPASKAQLAILQGQIAEKGTEVSYLRKLNERGVATSPRSGVVLFDDPTEWVGRPVVTGERIMMVAEEHAVEVEAWLSPADAIPLPEGAPVKLYLNSDPLKPVDATLRYVGHEAIERPDGHYAYRVRATLPEGEARPRVGLKGTAKLTGERVSLAYWMLRRPMAAARAWLGW